ncbi:FAD binding domain-containing protein [Talaromyces proteolyticus]|uniref:FAD binding domain-containing protein n=1 Tax=Talaromyces proteolyticus TaxID=1131652 RepID=A0AAD4KG32_9EURO|nr:FAD binding domain-containing protein [Talaromyces proteolyticus]KAH8691274.1 FAD binding domain-containing protein [Talaromyces proteolyticus]
MPYFAPLPQRDGRHFSPPPQESQVLVTGAGPSGLFAAYLLAKQSIRSAIVERHEYRLGQPKAHAINPRSLEIFRQKDAFWVRFNTGLTGIDLGALPYERQDEAVKQLTPEPLFNIPQPVLESFLEEAALATGLVTIHRGWTWENVSFDEQGRPKSKLSSRSEANKIMELTSDVLIGADGTDSKVRSVIDEIQWEAVSDCREEKTFYCSIHGVGSIRSLVTATNNLAQLYFCLHPAHPCGLIVYDLSGSWVHTHAVDRSIDHVEDYTQQDCRRLIDDCIGPGVEYTVQSANQWYTWPRVASSYHNKNVRLFLVGDAAHSFPPQGGLGINTGIADVHNLIWKLDYAFRRRFSGCEQLLTSYTQERRPVAIRNTLQSATNEKNWVAFTQFAGYMVNMASSFEGGDQDFFQQDYVKKIMLDAIAATKPHFDSLRLQLGYVYDKEAPIDTTVPQGCWAFLPSAQPGARLPHTWIDPSKSVLDLITYDGFMLLYDGGDFGRDSYQINGDTIMVDKINVNDLGNLPGWFVSLKIAENSGILVRPDQHILVLVKSDSEVEESLKSYLGE